MAVTRYNIRQAVSRLLGETSVGDVDTDLAIGTFGSKVLAVYDDDYFNDRFGRFFLGEHRDKDFTITDFAKTNGVITFDPDLSTATLTNDKYEIFPLGYTPTELNDAINLAISLGEDELLIGKVDTTIRTISSTFEYTIPSDIVFVERIIQEGGTTNRYSPSIGYIDSRHWRILDEDPPKLWFDDNYDPLTAGRNLRLLGQGKQKQLTKDEDLLYMDRTFVIYQAKALLHQARVSGEGEDFDGHRSQMMLAQAIADRERRTNQVAGRGEKVR
jgi:hypothetical protein